jgi:hypothetical protein
METLMESLKVVEATVDTRLLCRINPRVDRGA